MKVRAEYIFICIEVDSASHIMQIYKAVLRIGSFKIGLFSLVLKKGLYVSMHKTNTPATKQCVHV